MTIDKPPSDQSARVAASAEARWSVLVGAIVALLLGMMIYTSVHYSITPAARVEVVNPATLHLNGEFVESNLGTALEKDGAVTVRVIGNQYSFTPQCILVPAETRIHFRVTSADVVHGFLIAQTNVNVMLVPGYVSSVETIFHRPAELAMPCHEFCGIGHAAMWAHVKVIARDDFLKQSTANGRSSCNGR